MTIHTDIAQVLGRWLILLSLLILVIITGKLHMLPLMQVQHLPWLLPLDCLALPPPPHQPCLSLTYSLSLLLTLSHGCSIDLLPENKIHCWELLLSKANPLQPHDYS